MYCVTHGVSREGAAGATQRRRSCGFRSLRVVVISSESNEKCHALRHQSLEIFPSGLSRLSNSREALLYRLCVRRKRDCSSADGSENLIWPTSLLACAPERSEGGVAGAQQVASLELDGPGTGLDVCHSCGNNKTLP